MKKVFALISRLLLLACLIGYGPSTMAKTGSVGASFSITICANGEIQTLLVDADGMLVEPTANCQDCLSCCHEIGAQPEHSSWEKPFLILFNLSADPMLQRGPIVKNSMTRPMPRDPPMLSVSMLIEPT